MKKLVLVLMVAFLATNAAKAVEKGDFVIQPTFNLGSSYGWGNGFGTGSGFTPGLTLNADYAVHEYASVGAYAGANFGKGYTGMAFGARGVFHFWQLIDNKVDKDLKSEKIDFYLPLHLGYGIFKIKDYGSDGYFNYGAGLGIRYYFTKNIGAAFEFGGQELSYAKIGVAFKF